MMAAAMLATSCNNDDEIKKDGENTVSKPETTSIPFAIKVDMSSQLSKIGFADNTTQVNVFFEDDDVNNLKLCIYSNEKSNPMLGKYHYGDLTLTDKNGIFEGNLELCPQMGMAPEDGEELIAFIQPSVQSSISFSNTSLEDVMKNSVHQYRGLFKFDGSTPIANPEEQNDQNFVPIPQFDENHLPIVKLTDTNTYFEFEFPNEDNIYISWTLSIGSSEIALSNEPHSISSNHKLFLAVDTEQSIKSNRFRLLVRNADNEEESSIIYSKLLSDMTPGVIYSVTRPQQN